MRRRTTTRSFFVLLCSFLFVGAFAQDFVHLTGKVSDSTGAAIVGATITVPGTGFTTVTQKDGTYKLSVPTYAKNLLYSAIGYLANNVAFHGEEVLDVVLRTGSKDLDEVIVTGAYNSKQSLRSAAYNAQIVTGEQLNTIRQPDLNNALAGKVAGLQVRSQSAAKLGSQSAIRLRGATGFSTGTDNSPIYVVDGTILPNINNLDQDDIETLNVLQGPAAGALFGSQGANGAIVITTKKGKKNNGFGVSVNSGVQLDYVFNLPKYQNEYAGGSSDTLIQYTYASGQPSEWEALSGKYYPDYSDDASWGPKMEGQEYIPWYAWYAGTKYSYKTASLTPQPSNAKDFFNVGVTSNNSVSFNSSGEKLNFKMAYQNLYIKGMVPTQSTKRNNLDVVTSYDINYHFSVGANITYNNELLNGEITDSYANSTTGSFNSWFHRDLDMNIMKELQYLKTDDGVYASWNHQNPTSYDSDDPDYFYQGNYWYNPYTYLNNLSYVTNSDRFFGSAYFTYRVNKDLKFTATYRKQQNLTWTENKRSSDLAASGSQTGEVGYYYTANTNSNRRNIEFLGNYDKHINDFSISGLAGIDLFKYLYKDNYAYTNDGLSIDNLYTIGNSVSTATTGNTRTEEQYRAVFANVNLGYQNYIFLNATARNDWYSTLPEDDNSVFSKSIGGSFVFTHFTSNILPWLNYGKVRASLGEVPKALGTSSTTFGAYRYPGTEYSINSNKWNSNLLMYTSSALVDPDIKGAVSRTFEVGLDLSFLQDKVTLSSTFYQTWDKKIPYTVSINGASGYTSMLTNIGKIYRSGMEFSLGLQPLSLPNFSWSLRANWSPLIKNNVEEISDTYGIDQTGSLGTIWSTSTVALYQVKGKRWGQLIGGGKSYDASGNPIVNSDGTAYVNNSTYNYGSVLPNSTGGIQNGFTIYKNLILNVNIDWQLGGKFASLSEMWGTYSGLTARTAALNDKGYNVRDDVASGGGVHVKGVTSDGTAVDTYVDAQTYFHNLYGNYIMNDFVYDLTFVKLREVSLGYTFPVKKLGLDKVFRSATFSVVARNLWLLYDKTNGDFDPSEISEVYGEYSNLPGSRSLGFNLQLNF
ncbi:MAG: SusC/RagA family TonB-linked outer membrane protein [Chitinophagaceae bacterium]